MAIFGIEEVEAEVEETFESRPKEKVNCVTSSWTNYGTCSYNYGFDESTINLNYNLDRCLQTKSRSITTHPAHGGSSCPALTQTRTCSCIDSMDGRITSGEACDDGNTANGDGCSNSGQIEDGFECTTDFPSGR